MTVFCNLDFEEIILYNLLTQNWPVRLVARTPGSHPGNRGSIPLRATKRKKYDIHTSG